MLISEISDFDRDDDVVQHVIDTLIDREEIARSDYVIVPSDDLDKYPHIMFNFKIGKHFTGSFSVDPKPLITIDIPIDVSQPRNRNALANLIVQFLRRHLTGSVLVHEYTHFVDWKETGRMEDTGDLLDSGDLARYFNSDSESSAYFREGMHRFKKLLVAIYDKYKKDPYLLGDEKLSELAWSCINENFVSHLPPEKKPYLDAMIYEYIESQRGKIRASGFGRIGSIVPRR